MDGMQVLELTKRRDPTIEVIILTGHGDSDSSAIGLKHGAYAYIMKPVDIEDLAASIRQAAAKRAASMKKE
jgi:DNA-binding NtrC family response regulator